LGIDSDSKEDILRGIDFAKKVDAYQLQPAILTPFPKTAIYEQLKKEDRIITKEWSSFDMMNVTFIPKKMSPWELQKLFLVAVRRFYTFSSSFKIGKIFGISFALRRMGMSFLVKLAVPTVYIVSSIAKNTNYYRIRHVGNRPETG
jgi:radical SAM superfamily enzyme YgiQ (UPF0313 family)